MAFQMRKSKFRHVFGKGIKKEECYDGVRITKTSWDSTFCCANPKYMAIITEAAGGGSFLVLPMSKGGRVERDAPTVSGHTAAVLDIAWCPHNDDVIASASEDCRVMIWNIPEGGLVTNLTEPVVTLVAHQRRVGLVVWHPSAHNVLLSAGSDNKIFIWNVGTGEAYVEVELPDLILSASFNFNGSKFVCTCKDKMMRVINARTGDVITEGKAHQGTKPAQAVYLKDNKVFTTGFSRMSERQYAVWKDTDFSKPLGMDEIDNNNAVMFPFYDQDLNMIYLLGKGDSTIRYYEITDEAPYAHFLSMYVSKDAQRGFGFMSKRGVNVNTCEVARILKLHNSGYVEIIPFTVPRKSELFQEDLYPDTASDTPAISAEEWIGGKDADPILMSLKQGFVSTGVNVSVVRKSNILDKKIVGTPAKVENKPNAVVNTPAPSAAAAPATANVETAAPTPVAPTASHTSAAVTTPDLPPGFDANGILEDIRKLKLIVKAHERRIKTLEEKVAQYEGNTSEEDALNGEEC